jgi:hypothetical protein
VRLLPLEATVQLFSARGRTGVDALRQRVGQMLSWQERLDRRV